MMGIVRSAAAALLSCTGVAATSALAADYVVDGQDVIMAVGLGQTSDGKSLDMLLLEMEGNTIHVKGAFVFTTQTEGTTLEWATTSLT